MSRAQVALLLAFGCGIPTSIATAQVGLFGHHHHDCCPRCAQPPAVCTCQTVKPVVSTHLERQQVVTYQNVSETRYRHEQVVQRVPTVRYQDVTVDAGEYKMVWVPRPVTKRVAQVECRDEVSTRSVPYTVTRSVPQVSTRFVPRRTVQYVTQQHTIAVAPQPTCTTCGPTPFATTYAPIALPTAAVPTSAPNPVTLSPIAPTASLPAYSPTNGEVLYEQARLPETELTTGPQPDPTFSVAAGATSGLVPEPTPVDEWTTIGQRSDPTPMSTPTIAHGEPHPHARSATRNRFVPVVPSAAAVWQATGPVRR